jgi:hypothetical protein
MNTESRILTLDPELVTTIREQIDAWNKELKDPWIPSPAALSIVQTIKNSCPTMASLLEKAGILEAWAEDLHDKVSDLMHQEVREGREAGSALNQAMMELIPWSWEMQEEWLEAHCLEYEPEANPDLYGPEDPRHSQYEEPEEEEEEEDDVPTLKFRDGDLSKIQLALVKSIKALLVRSGIESREVMCLGAMLSLIERLPRFYEKYSAHIELSSDMGTGVGIKSFTLNADGLMLDVGEIIRGEWGSDSSSKTILLITEKSSSSSDPFLDLEEWLTYFSNDAADVDVDFRVDWFPEDEMPNFRPTLAT